MGSLMPERGLKLLWNHKLEYMHHLPQSLQEISLGKSTGDQPLVCILFQDGTCFIGTTLRFSGIASAAARQTGTLRNVTYYNNNQESTRATTIAVAQNGSAYFAAKNGALYIWTEGNPYASLFFSPVLHDSFIAISCGKAHTLALTESGALYSWGSGSRGRLGTGDEHDVDEPRLVESLRDHRVSCIAAGQFHSAATTDDGIAFTWGDNADGRLGLGNAGGRKLTPCMLRKPAQVAHELSPLDAWGPISCGTAHTGCITRMGYLFTWGRGSNGQLGHGLLEDNSSPTLVRDLCDATITHFSAGTAHSIALCNKGDVYIFGCSSDDQGWPWTTGLSDHQLDPGPTCSPRRIRLYIQTSHICASNTGLLIAYSTNATPASSLRHKSYKRWSEIVDMMDSATLDSPGKLALPSLDLGNISASTSSRRRRSPAYMQLRSPVSPGTRDFSQSPRPRRSFPRSNLIDSSFSDEAVEERCSDQAVVENYIAAEDQFAAIESNCAKKIDQISMGPDYGLPKLANVTSSSVQSLENISFGQEFELPASTEKDKASTRGVHLWRRAIHLLSLKDPRFGGLASVLSDLKQDVPASWTEKAFRKMNDDKHGIESRRVHLKVKATNAHIQGSKTDMESALFSQPRPARLAAHLLGKCTVDSYTLDRSPRFVRNSSSSVEVLNGRMVPTFEIDKSSIIMRQYSSVVPRAPLVAHEVRSRPNIQLPMARVRGLPFGKRFVTYVDLQEKARVLSTFEGCTDESLEMVRRGPSINGGSRPPSFTSRSKRPTRMVRREFHVPSSIPQQEMTASYAARRKSIQQLARRQSTASVNSSFLS